MKYNRNSTIDDETLENMKRYYKIDSPAELLQFIKKKKALSKEILKRNNKPSIFCFPMISLIINNNLMTVSNAGSIMILLWVSLIVPISRKLFLTPPYTSHAISFC